MHENFRFHFLRRSKIVGFSSLAASLAVRPVLPYPHFPQDYLFAFVVINILY